MVLTLSPAPKFLTNLYRVFLIVVRFDCHKNFVSLLVMQQRSV